MARVMIGLGSNIGDREDYLKKAVQMLDKHAEVDVIKLSSLYETEPYGPVQQSHFLNLVIEIQTELSPLKLLSYTQSIEKALNRVREVHWGPRTIDLDILLYDNIKMKTEVLTIPHPELAKRLFVLVPLNEIDPDYIVPDLGKSVQELLNCFSEIKGVRLWKQKWGRRIRAFRKLKGYTQAELADSLGVSLSILGEIERGNRVPSEKIIQSVAETLGITVDELIKFNN